MKSASVRNAHYLARTTAPLLTPVVEQVNANQKANFAARCRDYYPVQQAVIVVLDNDGVPTTDYPYYLAFAEKLYRFRLTSSGPALSAETANQLALFVARGLLQPTLEHIRDNVFGVAAPVGP